MAGSKRSIALAASMTVALLAPASAWAAPLVIPQPQPVVKAAAPVAAVAPQYAAPSAPSHSAGSPTSSGGSSAEPAGGLGESGTADCGEISVPATRDSVVHLPTAQEPFTDPLAVPGFWEMIGAVFPLYQRESYIDRGITVASVFDDFHIDDLAGAGERVDPDTGIDAVVGYPEALDLGNLIRGGAPAAGFDPQNPGPMSTSSVRMTTCHSKTPDGDVSTCPE